MGFGLACTQVLGWTYRVSECEVDTVGVLGNLRLRVFGWLEFGIEH